MANILTGIISLEAKGVSQTTSQVSNAVGKAEQSLKRLTPASNQANTALVNLSRVAQDAPFGFIGIANNLDPLLQSFQRLKAETGSTGGALKSLGSVLTGPAGIALGLSVVSSAIIAFGDKLFGTRKEISEAEIAAGRFGNALRQLRVDADNLRQSLEFQGTVKKLALELSGLTGGRLTAAQFGVDSETNVKLVEDRSKRIIALEKSKKQLITERIAIEKRGAELTGNVSNLGSLFLQFGENIPKEATGKLTESEKAILDRLNATNEEIRKLGDERTTALQNVILAPLRSVAALQKDIKTDRVQVRPDKVTVKPLTAVFDIDLEGPAVFAADSFGNYFSTELGNYFKKPITTDFSLLQALQPKLKTEAQKLAESFNSILSAGFQDSFSSLGEGLGNALSGKDFGAGLTEALGGLLSSLGKALIQYGAIKEGLDKIFGAGGFAIPGAVAIGLGVLAIAAGKAISNFGGGRAVGGAVKAGTGYLVGENGPEYFQPGTSGSIIPNGRLSTMSGGGFAGRVVFEISGNKLIGVLANGNRSQGALI